MEDTSFPDWKFMIEYEVRFAGENAKRKEGETYAN